MEPSLNRRIFHALSHWYLCLVLLLALQLTAALFWSVFGSRGGGFERFLDLGYLNPAYRLGEMLFLGKQMSLGNVPLGLGLLLLVVILYAFLGGTIVCLIYWISSALFRGKEYPEESPKK
jgi:hypothetical protein